jgi:hypothetical protein
MLRRFLTFGAFQPFPRRRAKAANQRARKAFRRRLACENLEPRALLTGLSLSLDPGVGQVSTPTSGKVVTVPPGTAIPFTARVTSLAGSLTDFHLSFASSQIGSQQLVLKQWALDNRWNTGTDNTLDTSLATPDVSVAASMATGVTTPATLGTFTAIAPTVVGEYRLTVHSTNSGDLTSFGSSSGPVTVDNYGDITVKVLPGVSVTATDAVKSEGAAGTTSTFTFTVTLTQPLASDLSIPWRVNVGSGLTAASASDFSGGVLPTGTAIIPAGQTSAQFTVNVAGDATAEADENFTVKLSNLSSSAAVFGTDSATGTIRNDDGTTLAIVAVDATKPEGHSGVTQFIFNVVRGGKNMTATTVHYALDAVGTADAADFSGATSGNLTFAADDASRSQTVTIGVVGDAVVENPETFRLKLTLVDPATGPQILTGGDAAAGLIQNDDASLSITATSANKAEGDAGTTPFTFTVTRTGATANTATVKYTVTGNGASAADFSGGVFPSGTLTFGLGVNSQTVTLDVVGDTTQESDEGFAVTLSDPVCDDATVNLFLKTGTATGTIKDDDGDVMMIAADTPDDTGIWEANAGSIPFTFTVTRKGLTSQEVTVHWAVTGSSDAPANGADFVGGALPSGNLTLAANETSKKITVLVQGDTTPEFNEEFTVTLSSPSLPLTLVTPSATELIVNEDIGLSISQLSSERPEGNSGTTDFLFRVTRTANSTGSMTVKYEVLPTGGTANEADFAGNVYPKDTVTFGSDSTLATITIRVQGDTAIEPDETFTVKISDPSPSTNVTIVNATATGTITNDDQVVVSIAAAEANKAEGTAGATTPFTFRLTRTGSVELEQMTVDWAVSSSGANKADAADFAENKLPTGTATFAAGETTTTVVVNVKGDTDVEADESFIVGISNPSPATNVVVAQPGDGGNATGTIRNDDVTLGITATGASKAEGGSGTTPFVFTVNRAGDLSGTTIIRYQVSGSGTHAAEASDFSGGLFPEGFVTFSPTDSVKTVTIAVNGDNAVESDEGFTVTLTNAPANVRLAPAAAEGTIQTDDSAVEIAAKEAVQTEGNTGTKAFTFTVTRSGLTTGVTTVDYAVTSGGSGQPDATDFGGTAMPQDHITFLAGETTKTLTINVNGDTAVENNENFTVTLSATNPNVSFPTATAAGTIQNDDGTSLAIEATAASKAEGNAGSTPFTFTVTRSGITTGTLTVVYAVTGTGANPADATDFTGGQLPVNTLTFLDGQNSRTVAIAVSGDTAVEADESFTVTLSNPDPATDVEIVTPTATGTIQTDDGANFAITADQAVQSEGDSGTKNFTFKITRTGLKTETISLDYAVSGNGTNQADAADFGLTQFPHGTVTFLPGDETKTVTIEVNGDKAVEQDEGFRVTISNALPVDSTTRIVTATADGTILNDDTSVAIAATDAAKAEGNADTTPFTFTVTRSGLTTGQTKVDYAVSGTGTPPANAADFGTELPRGTVTFEAGETTKTVTVSVAGDVTPELDEQFTVTITPNGADPATISTATATGTIQNDDNVALAIAATDAAKPEGNSGTALLVFTVTRAGQSQAALTVDYTVAGSGTNPANASDFSTMTGKVTFAAGETSKTLTVTVNGDTSVEPDETFTVTLSNPVPSESVQLITPAATGTIQTDDTGLAIAATAADKAEGDSGTTDFTFTVTRTGQTTGAATVSYTVAGSGTHAVNAADFGGTLPSGGTVTFGAGETSKTLTISVSGDLTVEADEQFTVTLSGPSAGAQLLTSTANGTVRNNDSATLSIADQSVAEGDSGTKTMTFVVTLDNAVDGGCSVAFTTAAGTAAANTDYKVVTASPLRFTGTAGETHNILVTIYGDRQVEGDETFTVTLGAITPLGAVAASSLEKDGSPATGTITNDDDASVVQLPTVSGGVRAVVRRHGANLQVLVSGRTTPLFNQPLSSVLGLQIYGVAGQSDQVTLAFNDGGTFSLSNPLTFDGGSGAGTNVLVVHGTTGADTVQVNRGSVVAGKLTTSFSNVSRVRLEGDAGDDTYKLAASAVPVQVVDSVGGNKLDLSSVTGGGVTVDLGRDRGQAQSIAPWHTTLAVTGQIAEMIGTKYADVLTGGNAAATVLRGLGGNDLLRGGAGVSVLLGGDGADTLCGGTGNNLLIGGRGADMVYGGGGSNVLVGGTTSYDNNSHTLVLLAQQGATRGFLASSLRKGSTVQDDGVRNRLFGGAGSDWYMPCEYDSWS